MGLIVEEAACRKLRRQETSGTHTTFGAAGCFGLGCTSLQVLPRLGAVGERAEILELRR